MADRLVTHVARNSDGDILSLANPETTWFQRRRDWAIQDIESGRHRYFVPRASRPDLPIRVVHGPSGAYLRSAADDDPGNNLDNLPAHERQAWEIAHHNAEVLAVHSALVPHGSEGQVLLLGGDEHDMGNADAGDIANTRTYDVATNAVLHVDSPEADTFCCGHAYLPDGRLLVGGGTENWRGLHVDAHDRPREHWSGARDCAAYNNDGTWTALAPMLTEPGQPSRGGGRWYPTLVSLADGRVLAVGGHPRVSEDPDVNDGRHGNWLPEIYDPAADTWTHAEGHWLYVAWGDVGETPLPPGQVVGTVDSYLYYARVFVLPGGRVFLASPDNGVCAFYDADTGLLDELTISPPVDGVQYAETNHTAVLLPLLPGDGYTPRVLMVGPEGSHRITLDTSDPDAPPAWQPTAVRDWPGEPPLRRHGCAVLLPTGEVFLAGGIDSTEGSGLPDTAAVLEGEIYQPGIDWDSGGYGAEDTWTTTDRATVPRNYHSVALLLPNGLVLTAGSNLDGQSGGDSVKEYRIETFSPPYDGDAQRPEILQAPSSLEYGETFQIVTGSAGRIQRVALMRCGSVTHAWDGDQRYVGLAFDNPAPGVLGAVAPPAGASPHRGRTCSGSSTRPAGRASSLRSCFFGNARAQPIQTGRPGSDGIRRLGRDLRYVARPAARIARRCQPLASFRGPLHRTARRSTAATSWPSGASIVGRMIWLSTRK